MDIFVCVDLNETQEMRLRNVSTDHRMHLAGGLSDDAPRTPSFGDCEIVFGNPPANWLADCPQLRWIQLESVGFGEYEQSQWPVLGTQVTLTNLAGFFADPVAESALAGILALYRGIDQVSSLRRENRWVGDDIRQDLRLLRGANVVLFGRGAINSRLEELLEVFHCHVISFGRDWTDDSLNKALLTADVVVSTVPGTAETRGVFSKDRLGRLPDTAVFANFGRGSVVDEDALAEALSARSLAGAVLDVTNDEPLPSGHRFWNAPNVILTQHSGGGSVDEIDRKIDVFEENLERYRKGKPLIGVVDFERGY